MISCALTQGQSSAPVPRSKKGNQFPDNGSAPRWLATRRPGIAPTLLIAGARHGQQHPHVRAPQGPRLLAGVQASNTHAPSVGLTYANATPSSPCRSGPTPMSCTASRRSSSKPRRSRRWVTTRRSTLARPARAGAVERSSSWSRRRRLIASSLGRWRRSHSRRASRCKRVSSWTMWTCACCSRSGSA